MRPNYVQSCRRHGVVLFRKVSSSLLHQHTIASYITNRACNSSCTIVENQYRSAVNLSLLSPSPSFFPLSQRTVQSRVYRLDSPVSSPSIPPNRAVFLNAAACSVSPGGHSLAHGSRISSRAAGHDRRSTLNLRSASRHHRPSSESGKIKLIAAPRGSESEPETMATSGQSVA